MHNTAYLPPTYHHFLYHSYYQLRTHPRNLNGGSSQNHQNHPPPYHPTPNNEVYNIPHTEYPYYHPYYPPPPTNPNYLSVGSNSTLSFTPTGSMVVLRNSGADVEPMTDERDAEEVVAGVLIGAKKWTVEEDQRLISVWINIGGNVVVGID